MFDSYPDLWCYHACTNHIPEYPLKAVTMRAVERGVFGAPAFFVGDDMYWGQDRIEQVKSALKH